MAKRENVITLGSGELFIKEYTGTMPSYETFTSNDKLGDIKGGATLSYEGEWYEAKDDLGKITKSIITEETATLTSGILTWNGKTLSKLCSTARVSESGNLRTVKIGGASNDNGKSYALCFKHSDPIDGNVYIIMRGKNQGGIELAFAKDSETVIDAEFKALPQDNEGTLIQYIEEIGTSLPASSTSSSTPTKA